jgi:hypothetical protein
MAVVAEPRPEGAPERRQPRARRWAVSWCVLEVVSDRQVLVQDLGRCSPAERFPRRAVQRSGDGSEVVGAVPGEAQCLSGGTVATSPHRTQAALRAGRGRFQGAGRRSASNGWVGWVVGSRLRGRGSTLSVVTDREWFVADRDGERKPPALLMCRAMAQSRDAARILNAGVGEQPGSPVVRRGYASVCGW